jgi:hypothetical protein
MYSKKQHPPKYSLWVVQFGKYCGTKSIRAFDVRNEVFFFSLEHAATQQFDDGITYGYERD